MKRNELQFAITLGIFFGFFSIVTVIFLIWIYSPILVPLAYSLQDLAVKNKDTTLGYLLVALASFVMLRILIVVLQALLTEFKVAEFFATRFKLQKLFIGFGLIFLFLFLGWTSIHMNRKFTIFDSLFLAGFFLLGLYYIVIAKKA